MNSSILTDIKSMLNIDSTYTVFDTDLIIYINSALASLYMLGIGEPDFKITGTTETWSQLIDADMNFYDIKTYVYIKVKTVFDPPQSGSHAESLKEQLKELTWILNVKAESDYE